MKKNQLLESFYESELSVVDKRDDIYKIEKTLKRKKVKGKEMVLVKWLGYSSKHNSWISKESVVDI